MEASKPVRDAELPTAGEVTVPDGEHRKVTGGGKERAIRVPLSIDRRAF